MISVPIIGVAVVIYLLWEQGETKRKDAERRAKDDKLNLLYTLMGASPYRHPDLCEAQKRVEPVPLSTLFTSEELDDFKTKTEYWPNFDEDRVNDIINLARKRRIEG